MITAEDLHTIAWNLADRHGIVALEYADRAITEMEEKGDSYRTRCWIALKTVLEDVLVQTESNGTPTPVAPVLH